MQDSWTHLDTLLLSILLWMAIIGVGVLVYRAL